MGQQTGAFHEFHFSLARGGDRAEAIEHRRRIYTDELGYHGVDAFDAVAQHIVARSVDGEMVGASRLLGPETRPLEIEQHLDLTDVVLPDSRPAQIGGLWVRPEVRSMRSGYMLPLALLRCLVQIAERHSVTDLVLRTHVTSVKSLYLRAGFVEQPRAEFFHPSWGTVFVMTLDLRRPRPYERGSADSLLKFIFEGELAHIDLSD